MNTRQAIQPSDQPSVLSLAFSISNNRFIAGLSEGIRLFRSDNCLTTHHLQLPKNGGVAIAEAADDRYMAYVGGGQFPASSPNFVVFWDAVENRAVNSFDFHEPVRGLRVNERWMVVLLETRAVVFEHQQLTGPPTPPPEDTLSPVPEPLKAPNQVHAIYHTAANPHALISLQGDTLALPSATIGQVQLIPLDTRSKRVIPAHTSALRALAISRDSTLLATASETGTLIRVFALSTTSRVAEFRRGVETAITYSLAFSPRNRWLASTSDKGTLHIFDLRPPPRADPSTTAAATPSPRSRPPSAASYPATHRLSSGGGGGGLETTSNPSSLPGTTNTSYPASAQEYYGLRPPPLAHPAPNTPSFASSSAGGAAATALAALKASPFAPRLVHDIRSTASAPFYTGHDAPHWQDGGPEHVWTTAPNGTRRRVRRAVVALPGNAGGRPVKGVVGFANAAKGSGDGEEDQVVIYVIGGGSDARWEMFEMLRADQGIGWKLVYRGFRRFMTRQYA